jgi:hypothetical protein
MKIRPRISFGVVLSLAPASVCFLLMVFTLSLAAARPAWAQKSPAPPKTTTPPPPANARLKITVTGGDNNAAVENASVYVKYVEEHAITKDKKLELNVKTSREGVAHVPNAPTGRVLIQVVADGWKSYGRWYDITDPNQEFNIHLERPPKWY